MRQWRKHWRKLSIEFSIALFGLRAEIDIIPFQFAKPQIGFSKSFIRERRLPSFKAGPINFWMMSSDKIEIGFSVDLQAAFHRHPFQEVYPGSFVWPKYSVKRKES